MYVPNDISPYSACLKSCVGGADLSIVKTCRLLVRQNNANIDALPLGTTLPAGLFCVLRRNKRVARIRHGCYSEDMCPACFGVSTSLGVGKVGSDIDGALTVHSGSIRAVEVRYLLLYNKICSWSFF